MDECPSYASFGVLYRRRKKQVRILLVQESHKNSRVARWKLAGGKVETEDADPRQTLIRELEEKISVRISERRIGTMVTRVPLRLHTFITYAVAIGKKHAPKMNPEKVTKMKWFYQPEIDYLISHDRILPNHTSALKHFLSTHA